MVAAIGAKVGIVSEGKLPCLAVASAVRQIARQKAPEARVCARAKRGLSQKGFSEDGEESMRLWLLLRFRL